MKALTETALQNKKTEIQEFMKTHKNNAPGAESAIKTIDSLIKGEPISSLVGSKETKSTEDKQTYAPVKETVMSILSEKTKQTVKSIIEEAKKKGVELKQNSVSSTLSKLRSDGEVKREGEDYLLAKTKKKIV